MSGSWPEGAPDNAYQQLIELANQYGKKSFLDCTSTQLHNALKSSPFAIHLNHKERNEFNSEVKCEIKAITAGIEGLYLTVENKTIHGKCTIDNVYSAVGSGDCLLAGLVVSYKRGLNHKEMARFSTACGTANCMREDLGMIYKTDVEDLIKRVELNDITDQIK